LCEISLQPQEVRFDSRQACGFPPLQSRSFVGWLGLFLVSVMGRVGYGVYLLGRVGHHGGLPSGAFQEGRESFDQGSQYHGSTDQRADDSQRFWVGIRVYDESASRVASSRYVRYDQIWVCIILPAGAKS